MANTLQRAKYLNLVGFPIPFHRSCVWLLHEILGHPKPIAVQQHNAVDDVAPPVHLQQQEIEKGVNQVIQCDLFLGFFAEVIFWKG